MNEQERGLAFRATPAEIEFVKSLPRAQLPKFSVAIPSFNQARFLPATLDSVIAQSYPNMEIFVADGGSHDDSVAILRSYAARNPQLLRFDSRSDGGQHHGVNKGIAATDGDVIAWINSDDLYLPEAFWKVAAFFYFNRGAMVVYGRNRYVDEALNFVIDYPVDWSPLLSEQRRRMMHFCLVPQPSLFFKRTAVRLCGALNHRVLDYELWLRWQRDLPFFFYDDELSLSRLQKDAVTVNADPRLLSEMCDLVHRYYGIVPYSWALRRAHNRVHGAAWTRGEFPPITKRIRLMGWWYWLWMNVKLSPRLFRQSLGAFRRWLAQGLRSGA